MDSTGLLSKSVVCAAQGTSAASNLQCSKYVYNPALNMLCCYAQGGDVDMLSTSIAQVRHHVTGADGFSMPAKALACNPAYQATNKVVISNFAALHLSRAC
jgi:hypothetical protein